MFSAWLKTAATGLLTLRRVDKLEETAVFWDSRPSSMASVAGLDVHGSLDRWLMFRFVLNLELISRSRTNLASYPSRSNAVLGKCQILIFKNLEHLLYPGNPSPQVSLPRVHLSTLTKPSKQLLRVSNLERDSSRAASVCNKQQLNLILTDRRTDHPT